MRLLIAEEVDSEIKSASWRKRLYRSYDGGATWEEESMFLAVQRLR